MIHAPHQVMSNQIKLQDFLTRKSCRGSPATFPLPEVKPKKVETDDWSIFFIVIFFFI